MAQVAAVVVGSIPGPGTSTCCRRGQKKKKSRTELTLFTKINGKWITDLNANYKSIKYLEDNIGENLDNLEYTMTF